VRDDQVQGSFSVLRHVIDQETNVLLELAWIVVAQCGRVWNHHSPLVNCWQESVSSFSMGKRSAFLLAEALTRCVSGNHNQPKHAKLTAEATFGPELKPAWISSGAVIT